MKFEAFADFLFANRAPNLPPEGLAEVFDRLVFCLSDRGKSVFDVYCKWITSYDKDKVSIALSMSVWFPYKRREDIESLAIAISERWPDLRIKCDKLISDYNASVEHVGK